jgi:predicted component of type VI protein secretion system
MLASN